MPTPRSLPSQRLRDARERPRCPECRLPMDQAKIVPGLDWANLRIFECITCDQVVRFIPCAGRIRPC